MNSALKVEGITDIQTPRRIQKVEPLTNSGLEYSHGVNYASLGWTSGFGCAHGVCAGSALPAQPPAGSGETLAGPTAAGLRRLLSSTRRRPIFEISGSRNPMPSMAILEPET